MFDQSNIFDDHGQFFVEASGAADLMVSQQAPAGQPVNKIRLFCSSCCTEFSSTADLNRHMERHQVMKKTKRQNNHILEKEKKGFYHFYVVDANLKIIMLNTVIVIFSTYDGRNKFRIFTKQHFILMSSLSFDVTVTKLW